jgi:hypothetical protein
VTCICSAALLSSLFTGATCTIVTNRLWIQMGHRTAENRAQTCIETYGHFQTKASESKGQKLPCFGYWKNFHP